MNNKYIDNELSLYIHIPFCIQKCLYCDFTSMRISDAERNNSIKQYIAALKAEIGLYEQELRRVSIKTIFIGGGTPSSIDGHYILEVVNEIKRFNSLDSLVEFTIEINPGTINDEKINAYLIAGINRASIGFQTSNDLILKKIGRRHSVNDFLTCYQGLRESGLKNISFDLMLGLPDQEILDIENALNMIRQLKPEHISAYSLKLEEGTNMYESFKEGKIILPEEEAEREMYHRIVSGLKELGYEQYELSNFAKPSFESRHNLVYWENKAYLGLGIASHSKLDGVRFNNTENLGEYLKAINNMKRPIEASEEISDKEDLFETIMLGLRLNKGISIKQLNEKYNIEFEELYKEQLERLTSLKLIEIGESIRLTEMGRDVSNQVFVEFMD